MPLHLICCFALALGGIKIALPINGDQHIFAIILTCYTVDDGVIVCCFSIFWTIFIKQVRRSRWNTY